MQQNEVKNFVYDNEIKLLLQDKTLVDLSLFEANDGYFGDCSKCYQAAEKW